METPMNEPIHATDRTFEETVPKASLPVVVDFWAPWCAPCRMLAPSLEKIAAEYAGRLVVAKVNTDEASEWAVHFGLRGIPTVLFVSGGEVLHDQVGAVPYPYLQQAVDQFLDLVKPTRDAAT
jgi:thioredoxin